MVTPNIVLSSVWFGKVVVDNEQYDALFDGTENLGGVVEVQFVFHLKKYSWTFEQKLLYTLPVAYLLYRIRVSPLMNELLFAFV